MRGSDRWSLLDGSMLRRRASAREILGRYLDLLVDAFDFPITDKSSSSAPEAPTSRHSTPDDIYIEMIGSTPPAPRPQHSTKCSSATTALTLKCNGESDSRRSNFSKRRHSMSMSERLRGFLLRSSRERASPGPQKRNTLAVTDALLDCRGDSAQAPERLLDTEKSSLEREGRSLGLASADDLAFHCCGEEDRPLQCSYSIMP